MNIWDTLPVPFWDAADEGGGSGAGDGAGGQGDGDGGGDAPDWREGLSDDDKAFVGDRDLAGFIEYAKSQRTAAGARVDAVTKEHGLIKPITATDDAGEFFHAFRPETADAYAAKLGLEADKVSAADKIAMEAAYEAGLHPDQYRAMTEKQAMLRETADKAAATEMVAQIKTDWGADFDANSQAVDRAVKMLGLGDAFTNALSAPGMGATPADYRAIMEGLKDIGLNAREGGGPGAGEGGSAQSAQEQLAALEAEIVAAHGKKTPDQVRRMGELQKLVAQEKAA